MSYQSNKRRRVDKGEEPYICIDISFANLTYGLQLNSHNNKKLELNNEDKKNIINNESPCLMVDDDDIYIGKDTLTKSNITKTVKKAPYHCSIHEDDREICNIYDCMGGNHVDRKVSECDYIL